MGWMAEHSSWMKPGSSSSRLCSPPPAWLCRSITQVDRPRSANRIAALSPLGPEPTTSASNSVIALRIRILSHLRLGSAGHGPPCPQHSQLLRGCAHLAGCLPVEQARGALRSALVGLSFHAPQSRVFVRTPLQRPRGATGGFLGGIRLLLGFCGVDRLVDAQRCLVVAPTPQCAWRHSHLPAWRSWKQLGTPKASPPSSNKWPNEARCPAGWSVHLGVLPTLLVRDHQLVRLLAGEPAVGRGCLPWSGRHHRHQLRAEPAPRVSQGIRRSR